MTDKHDELNADLDFDFNLSDDDLSETAVVETTVDQRTVPAADAEKKRKMALFSRIPVQLTLEVASAEISLSELMSINNDSVIELDKLAGEPLDVKVNGILFGKAEVVVVNDKYGLRIIEFNSKDLDDLGL